MSLGYVGHHRSAPVIYDGVLLAGVPRHRTTPPRRKRVPWQVPVIASLCVLLFAMLGMQVASAQVSGPGSMSVEHVKLTLSAYRTVPRYVRAYDWALSQRGCWYTWGGTGPCWAGYDCSGLVYSAYQHAGVSYFGRDTYDMLNSGRLHLVHHPHPGELAFFGTGHVELYVGGNWTFGAQDSGTQVGFHQWNDWWHPTAIYYVWGST